MNTRINLKEIRRTQAEIHYMVEVGGKTTDISVCEEVDGRVVATRKDIGRVASVATLKSMETYLNFKFSEKGSEKCRA